MAKLGQYDLTELTAQQVFDYAALHLMEQSERSMDCHGGCLYNSNDGICCVAAPFLSNYNKDMEGEKWSELVDREAVTSIHSSIVEKLQLIHDDNYVNRWSSELFTLANRLSLNSDILNNWHYNEQTERYEKRAIL